MICFCKAAPRGQTDKQASGGAAKAIRDPRFDEVGIGRKFCDASCKGQTVWRREGLLGGGTRRHKSGTGTLQVRERRDWQK